MNINPTKRDTLVKLMNGEFICSYTAKPSYEYLLTEDGAREVSEALLPFGKVLADTGDATGYSSFYAAHIEPYSKDTNSAIKSQMREMRDVVRPVTDFFVMLVDAGVMADPPRSGDSLSLARVTSLISEKPALVKALKAFQVSYRRFKPTKADPNVGDRVASILKGLQDMGYLCIFDKDVSMYSFTGKLSYYYKCIEFIIEHERDDMEDDEKVTESAEQGGLL